MQIEGDLIIALSDGAFVSFAMSFPETDKRLIAIRSFQGAPFRFTNVSRNLVAHELGHGIGLGHNDDPGKLMWQTRAMSAGRLSFRRRAFLSSNVRRKTKSAKALSADVEVIAIPPRKTVTHVDKERTREVKM